MLLNFDANQVEPFEAAAVRFPLGDYPFRVTAVTQKATKNNPNSGMLEVVLTIIDGPFKGVTHKDRFNLFHENADTKRIAYMQLSSLCRATGRLHIQDDQQLIGGVGIALFGPQDDNDKYSEVKCYKDINYRVNGRGEPQKFEAQPQPQQAPAQSTEAAPWGNNAPVTPQAPSATWGTGTAAVEAATQAATQTQGATPPWAQGGIPAQNAQPTPATMPPWAK